MGINLCKIVKLGIGIAAMLLAGLISHSAAAATVTYPQSFATGWNLAGNSLITPITVRTTFGAQAGITSIWKWDAAGAKWAFYAPSLDMAGTLASYAASKGYTVLTTINQGEGYWVNASAPVLLGTASGTGISLAAANLTTGWNLAATGDAVASAAFTTTVGNVTTLWAWDNVNNAWYFYAPTLAASNTLASYILTKGYKDFGALTLDNGRGFWVNYAGVAGITPVTGLMGGAVQGVPLNLTGLVTTNLSLTYLGDMTTDGTSFYVADRTFYRVTKFNPITGAQSTLAGAFTVTAGFVDGIGVGAQFGSLGGITTDGTNLYVSDTGNHSIRKIVIATGAVTTLAGSGTAGFADGTGTAALFNQPGRITTDNTNLYVSDFLNNRIRKIVIATGAVTTLAGSGVASRVDGVGTAATFSSPYAITTDGTNLYESDFFGAMIRKIEISTGIVTTLKSGGFVVGASADVRGITTDGANLYITDNNSGKLVSRIVLATGVMSTLAGGATNVAATVDGTGAAAKFNAISAITSDGTSLYVVDGQLLRKIQ